MDSLIVIKDCLIHMIDNCEKDGTIHETMRQLRFYFDLFCENDYAYKGVELCNRLILSYEYKNGEMPTFLYNRIVELRDRFFICQQRGE